MAQQQLFAGEQGLAVNKGLWLPRTREEIIVGFGGLEGGIGAHRELRRTVSLWGSSVHPTAATDLRHWFYLGRHTRSVEHSRTRTIQLCHGGEILTVEIRKINPKCLLKDLKPLSTGGNWGLMWPAWSLRATCISENLIQASPFMLFCP